MQDGDTPLCDATRARLAQASELLELVRNQTRTVVDPADPWRGLYHPSRLPARNADGEIHCHPDVPTWSDGREASLQPLFLAQGFDLQVTFGDFTEEAVEVGDHRYWDEMRTWEPVGPGADWRLVWLGDTEDGPTAWFVRPLAPRRLSPGRKHMADGSGGFHYPPQSLKSRLCVDKIVADGSHSFNCPPPQPSRLPQGQITSAAVRTVCNSVSPPPPLALAEANQGRNHTGRAVAE